MPCPSPCPCWCPCPVLVRFTLHFSCSCICSCYCLQPWSFHVHVPLCLFLYIYSPLFLLYICPTPPVTPPPRRYLWSTPVNNCFEPLFQLRNKGGNKPFLRLKISLLLCLSSVSLPRSLLSVSPLCLSPTRQSTFCLHDWSWFSDSRTTCPIVT